MDEQVKSESEPHPGRAGCQPGSTGDQPGGTGSQPAPLPTAPAAVEFQIGDPVVYPLQDVGTVKGIAPVKVRNKEEVCYVIETDKLNLKVPVKKAAELGIRKIVAAHEIEDAYNVLRGPSGLALNPEGDKWAARYDELKQRVKYGGILELARVVRDLYKNSVLQQLNQMEKELLENAKKSIVEELVVVENIIRKKLQQKVNMCLRENVKRNRIER